jgi:predicted PurR-regulated permease PerM
MAEHTRHRRRSGDEPFVRKAFTIVAVASGALLLWALSEICLLVFGSVLLALILRFVAEEFSAYAGMRQSWSLLMAGLVVLGLLVVAIFLFGAQLRGQFELLSSQLSSVEQTVTRYFDRTSAKDLLSGTSLGTLFAGALSWGTTAITVLTSFVLVIVGGIYMAVNPEVYRTGLIKLFPPEWHPEVGATLDAAARALRLWLGAQLVAMVLVGVMITAGALALGIPSALALGLIFGLTEFVPVIGPIVGAVPVLFVAVGQSWEMAVWALSLVVLIQQIESNLIMPIVSGKAVQLPPAVGLFAVIAMGVLFGPLGLVLGYPLAVVSDVAIRRLYVRQLLGEQVEIAGEDLDRRRYTPSTK